MTGSARVDGVDISKYQSGSLNFSQAKTAGVKFVVHKATEGTSIRDPRFAARRKQVKQAGLLFGAYHYATPSSSGEAQARYFLAFAKPVNGELAPMLDLEHSGFATMSVLARTEWVRQFVNVIHDELGVFPFVYTHFTLSDNLNCPLWASRYSSKMYSPPVPAPWKQYTIWQFSNGVIGSPNTVPGLGHVDISTINSTNPSQLLKLMTIGYKPPVVKSPDARIQVATANIKNFPDMTDKQVRQDAATVRDSGSDLILFQEIGEKADVKALTDTFDSKDWFVETHGAGTGGRSNAIAFKKSVFEKVGNTTVTKIGPGMGKGSHAPDQWLVGVTLRLKDVPHAPLIDVYGIHFIQGAFGHPGQVGDKDGRRIKSWNDDMSAVKKLVLASRKADRISIFGGDWNRAGKDIPLLDKSQVWIVAGGAGIDNVGALAPTGVSIQRGKQTVTNLNSDHDLKTGVLRLFIDETPVVLVPDSTQPPRADSSDPRSYHVGARNTAVKWLADRLVAHGYGRFYKNGTDYTFTKGEDLRAVRQFQLDQGWRGADADGLPGSVTLRRLKAAPKKK